MVVRLRPHLLLVDIFTMSIRRNRHQCIHSLIHEGRDLSPQRVRTCPSTMAPDQRQTPNPTTNSFTPNTDLAYVWWTDKWLPRSRSISQHLITSRRAYFTFVFIFSEIRILRKWLQYWYGIESSITWVRFLFLAHSKLRQCSANPWPGYWNNLPCDWPSTAWAYSEQETENGPRFHYFVITHNYKLFYDLVFGYVAVLQNPIVLAAVHCIQNTLSREIKC